MTDKERLETIKELVKKIESIIYDEWRQQELTNLIESLYYDDHVDWLINRIEELEKQRNERTQLLNAEVARNVRYKKVLEKIVNHAGKGIDIDYELWKTAKKALGGEE